MTAPIRALPYARCSTSEQDYSRQLSTLLEECRRRGWVALDPLGSYVSGAENDGDLNELFSRAHRREFDRLLVWELSRLSRRGPAALLSILERFRREGVRVWSYSETWLDTDGPAWDLLVAIFGWVAKWERDMISARTKSALAQRRALGVRLGRPPGSRDRKPRHRRSWNERGRGNP